MRAGALLILALAAAPARAAGADEEPICADRPGKATSACTVPAGHWQVETGLASWSLQERGRDRSTSLVVGDTTVKYGLGRGADIELGIVPWQRATSRAGGRRERASGIGDVAIAFKQRLTAADAPLQLLIMPVLKAPVAARPLGNGKWESGLLIPISYAIGDGPFSIGLTPELDWAADADGRGHHAAMAQAAALGWAATERLSLSAELWGGWDWDPAGRSRQASADAAIAYRVGQTVQLDAGANVGLNRNTPDAEIYAGVSKRF